MCLSVDGNKLPKFTGFVAFGKQYQRYRIHHKDSSPGDHKCPLTQHYLLRFSAWIMIWCSAFILALLSTLELYVSSWCSKTGHFSSLWILRSREESLTNHEALKMNNAQFWKVLEKSWNLKTELQWEPCLRLIGVSEVILVFSQQTQPCFLSLPSARFALKPFVLFRLCLFQTPFSLSLLFGHTLMFFFCSHFVPFTLILHLPPAVPGREQRFVDNMLLETHQERWQCIPCDLMCVYVCVYLCVYVCACKVMGATEGPLSPSITLLLVPRRSGNTHHLTTAASQEIVWETKHTQRSNTSLSCLHDLKNNFKIQLSYFSNAVHLVSSFLFYLFSHYPHYECHFWEMSGFWFSVTFQPQFQ